MIYLLGLVGLCPHITRPYSPPVSQKHVSPSRPPELRPQQSFYVQSAVIALAEVPQYARILDHPKTRDITENTSPNTRKGIAYYFICSVRSPMFVIKSPSRQSDQDTFSAIKGLMIGTSQQRRITSYPQNSICCTFQRWNPHPILHYRPLDFLHPRRPRDG